MHKIFVNKYVHDKTNPFFDASFVYCPSIMNDPNLILTKAQKYCAYRERCQKEVRQRLNTWGVKGELAEQTIASLITKGFIDEERFARIFAGGKFRIKRWGRVKITNELKQRNITPYCIKAGMEEIEEEDYIKTLEYLMEKKAGEYKDRNVFIKNKKVATYCINKGYESEIVWSLIRKRMK